MTPLYYLEVFNMAKTSKAQIKATERFNAKAYDRVALRVPKGWIEELKEYAQQKDKSVNGLLNCFIAKVLGKSAPNDTIILNNNNTTNDTIINISNDTSIDTHNDTSILNNNDTTNDTIISKNSKALNKLIYEFWEQTDKSEISDLLNGNAKLTLVYNDKKTKPDKPDNTDTNINTNTDATDTNASKTKKSRKPAPTREMIEQWDILNTNGLSFAKIAKQSDGYGYEKTTISKAVASMRKSLPVKQ